MVALVGILTAPGAMASPLLAPSAAAAPVFETAASGAVVPGDFAPLAHLYGSAIAEGAAAAAAEASPLAFERGGEASAAREPGTIPGRKKAILLSLLLPGAGELSLGAKGRATGFFITEGLIWTHYAWFQVAGHLRRNDYIEQAQLNAGVGVSSGTDDYWRLVGKYATSSGTGASAYEDELRREARDNFPDDPAAQDAWVAQRLPTGDRAWAWSSAALQQTYHDTRESSRRAFDRAKYSFAAAILNRIVSVIDTQVIHRRLSRDAAARLEDGGFRLATDTASDGSGRLVLTRTF